jgi:hypothetical protein
MRGLTALILSLAFYSGLAAHAATDLSPIGCAWDKLSAAEQTRLRDEFKVELRKGSFDILFANPDAASAGDAARQCQLNVTPAQIEHLALGLARRAAEEKAKKGIVDHGESADSVKTALGKVHEGKREVIGDALACPGPHTMVGEWDESLKGAIRRANLRFQDGRAYSFVSLALYAILAQEGTMRRMAGTADACSPN